MQGIQQRRMKDLADEIGRNPGEYLGSQKPSKENFKEEEVVHHEE